MIIEDWANKHSVSGKALQELRDLLCTASYPENPDTTSKSEAATQNEIRLDAPRKNIILWRNNSGVGVDIKNVPVRFGLCNDSKKLNQNMKSSDLIGIRRILVTGDMVGKSLGQFIAIEVKNSNWKYKGTTEEQAQLNYLECVTAWGGEGKFLNNVKGL